MSKLKKQTQDDPTNQALREFTRRVMEGEKTADLFGVDDDFITVVVNKAYQFYANNGLDEAEVLLRGAAVLDQSLAFPHLLLGDILLRQAQYADAVDELSKACELDSDNAEALAKLGEAQVRATQYEAAVHTLKAAAEALPEESPHRKRAQALLEVAQRGGKRAEVEEQA